MLVSWSLFTFSSDRKQKLGFVVAPGLLGVGPFFPTAAPARTRSKSVAFEGDERPDPTESLALF